MAWTTPRTWVVGETVTAANMNTHVRDNFDYLKGSAGAVTIDDSLTLTKAGYPQLTFITTAVGSVCGDIRFINSSSALSGLVEAHDTYTGIRMRSGGASKYIIAWGADSITSSFTSITDGVTERFVIIGGLVRHSSGSSNSFTGTNTIAGTSTISIGGATFEVSVSSNVLRCRLSAGSGSFSAYLLVSYY